MLASQHQTGMGSYVIATIIVEWVIINIKEQWVSAHKLTRYIAVIAYRSLGICRRRAALIFVAICCWTVLNAYFCYQV